MIQNPGLSRNFSEQNFVTQKLGERNQLIHQMKRNHHHQAMEINQKPAMAFCNLLVKKVPRKHPESLHQTVAQHQIRHHLYQILMCLKVDCPGSSLSEDLLVLVIKR